MKLDMSKVTSYENNSWGDVDSTYTRYINSAAWKERREEALADAEYTCENCGQVGGLLHVHHLTYIRFGNEYPSDLQVLCVPCHKEADAARRARRWDGYGGRWGWGR